MAAALTTPEYSIDSLMNRITLSTTCEDHVHLLLLQNNGVRIKIGIIFLSEETQQGKVARTVDEVTQAILQGFYIYQYVKNREGFLLNYNCVPFYKNDLNIKIDNEGSLVIDDTIVTYQEKDGTKKEVKASGFFYEKGVYFEKLENGHYRITECRFKELDNGHYKVSPRQDTGQHKFFINDKKEVYFA